MANPYNESVNMLLNQTIISANANMYSTAFGGQTWVTLLYLFTLLVTYTTTKSAGATSAAGLLAASLLIYYNHLSIADHGIFYSIVVLTMAMTMFMAYYGRPGN